jgi:hypothetical protein
MAARLTQRLSTSISRLSNARTMSSAAPRKFEFLVVVPDKPGMLAKRLEVRSCVVFVLQHRR